MLFRSYFLLEISKNIGIVHGDLRIPCVNLSLYASEKQLGLVIQAASDENHFENFIYVLSNVMTN